MKHLVLFMFFLQWLLPAHSQLKFGIKGGFSTTQLDAQDFNVIDDGGVEELSIALKEAKYGIHGGLIIQGRIGNFLIQPEILFNSNSVDYEVTDLNTLSKEVFNEKFQYVDFPLLVGFKFGPLRLMGGPEGHIYINSTSDLFDFDDYDQVFEDVTLSWLAGIGLDIWSLALDVRYEGNFNKFGEHINFAGRQYNFADTPARWLFSLGFMF